MKSYTKTYLREFNLCETDYISCECCGGRASEIHHILNKNRLSKNRNRIENIMAICRSCHVKYGEVNYLISLLFKIHTKHMQINNIIFNENWILNKIGKYDVY